MLAAHIEYFVASSLKYPVKTLKYVIFCVIIDWNAVLSAQLNLHLIIPQIYRLVCQCPTAMGKEQYHDSWQCWKHLLLLCLLFLFNSFVIPLYFDFFLAYYHYVFLFWLQITLLAFVNVSIEVWYRQRNNSAIIEKHPRLCNYV